MKESPLPTEYASAERTPTVELERQCALLGKETLLRGVMDSVPSMSVILNQERQIVCANQVFLELFGSEVLGRRPGEAVNCIHACSCNGCGTTRFCRTCGALESILHSMEKSERSINECRLIRLVDDEKSAVDLHVMSKPVTIEEETFTIFSLTDISHKKRRRVLERIFFHDVMNTAGGMQGMSELLTDDGISQEEMKELAVQLKHSADELVDEIHAQKTINCAEDGDLVPGWQTIHAHHLVEQVENKYRQHPVATGKELVVDGASEPFAFTSDPMLLRRVLGNLSKNALEASGYGDRVCLKYTAENQLAVFEVQNPGVMPVEIQLQIFNRSFSTKGAGRGLGSYSVKLLTERYLQGTASFISAPEIGTVFKIELPLSPKHP